MTKAKFFSRIAVALCGATAIATIPSAAQAHETARDDASADVLLVASDGEDTSVDSDWAHGDITRLRAVHATSRVKARLAFEDLAKQGEFAEYRFRVRTNRSPFTVVVMAGPDLDGWQGISLVDNAERTIRCRGLRHDIDYGENRVRVSVPRSCLGRPKWVRVGASSFTVVRDEDTDEQEIRFDDALSAGEDGDNVLNTTVAERKLRRC